MFPTDWFKRIREQRSEAGPAPTPAQTDWREATHALAGDVEALCGLCHDLLRILAETQDWPDAELAVRRAPLRLETIRRTAGRIAAESRRLERRGEAPAGDPGWEDPYSLEALRRLMFPE